MNILFPFNLLAVFCQRFRRHQMNILKLLAEAASNQDNDRLREAIQTVNHDYAAAPLLAHILLEDWHDLHEDIVFELGLIGNPSAIESIAKAATMHFEYLVQWNNLHEFQRKCAYALARIGTAESREALEVLAQNSDPYLREYGQEGLQHWPMPYRHE